jgi:hypothetical protein
MCRLVVVLATVVLLLPSPATAAETQVNTRSSSAQANSAIAMDPRGGALVVWSSYYSGRSNDIVARQLDAAGARTREEFLVNAINVGNQTEPAAAIDRLGNLAVVWQAAGPDEDIVLRLYDPYRIPLTSDLLVNLRTDGRQLYPCVASGRAGTFLVAWESRETTLYGDQGLLCAQLFDLTGSSIGDEILVDPNVYNCRYPDAAMDAEGNFVVVWMQDRSNHPIQARLFDPNGVPRTDPFVVNTTRVSSVTRPSVAMNSQGRFIIAWDGDPNRAANDDVYARLYEPSGAPVGEPFLVNTIRDGAQQWPQVAINDANEFVVAWEYDDGDPIDETDIYARRFAADGQPIAAEFRVNTYTEGKQRYADVGLAADGTAFIVWESDGQDGAGYGIFLNVKRPPVANQLASPSN